MIISEEEKRTIAYHEAGHALVARPPARAPIPLHKVTIIPRGRALGLTQQLPTDDKYNYSRDYLINRITILLGGRAAEEIVLQQQTTGAGDDLEKATEMARKMVCEWGMSEKLGPLTFGKREEHIFLGRESVARQGLQRGDRGPHRRRDQADRRRTARPGRAPILEEQHREAPPPGPGAAGARVARRRGDRPHPPRPAVHGGNRPGLSAHWQGPYGA